MKKIVWLLYTIVWLSNTVWADCPNASQPISQGAVAPCSGVLMTQTAAKQLDQKLQQANITTQQNAILTQESAIKDDQIKNLTTVYTLEEQKSDLFSKEALDEAATLTKQQKEDRLRDDLLFGSGVLSAILIFFTVSKIR